MNEIFLFLGQKPSLKIRIVLSEKCRQIQGIYSLSLTPLNVGYSCLLPPASCLLITLLPTRLVSYRCAR